MEFNLERVEAALSSKYHRHDNYSDNVYLIDFLSRNLHLGNWKSRLEFGGTYINGICSLEDKILPNPAKIEYYEPKYDLENYLKIATHWDYATQTIYEDEYLAVVFKPVDLSSMPAKEQNKISLYHDLILHFGKDIHLPSRLDHATSGLILFSKHSKTHKSLQNLFEKKEIQKYYLFESNHRSDWKDKLVTLNISRTPIHQVLRVTSETSGSSAETLIERISDQINYLYLAKPKTGRTHQIRVHAAFEGINIIGDQFYNGIDDPKLHLLSYALKFTHPISNRVIILKCPERLFPDWVKPHTLPEIA